MGGGASKEELVYASVQRGDLSGIRALRQQGASLEVSAPHASLILLLLLGPRRRSVLPMLLW